MDTVLSSAQKALSDLWDEHLHDEFAIKDAAAAADTMVADASVNHVPVLTGGVGNARVKEFYSKHFIPKMPSDWEILSISRTIGHERVVEEMVVRFTHSIEMDWMLPGVPPTDKPVECPVIAVLHFRDSKIFSEHIYCDQASVLVQLGLLDFSNLPIAGVETARKLLDRSCVPSNQLLQRAAQKN